MEKISLAALVATVALIASPVAQARQGENHVNNNHVAAAAHGGFSGPSAVAAATVKEALEMRDDTYVTLRGNITESLGGEKYMFKDATGTIKIEIDDEDWQGLNVNPQDMVEIYGEIDKGWTKTEIDVDAIKLVK